MNQEIKNDLQVERLGNYLEGKKIALCVSGGIAAIEAPKIARHLRRYGAEVKAYVTASTYEFVGKASLEWGTGQAVVDKLSGLAEHICLEDLVLVAPATLNTINKIFTGLADNSLTTLISSALGMKKPIYLAPTMHESMYNHPILQKNLQTADQYNIKIIPPRREEHKAKMPRIENIVAAVCRELSEDQLKGKKIMITGGPTPAKIDDVRRIVAKFKGALAVEIAKDAYHRGAEVSLLLGKYGASVPKYLPNVKYHDSFEEYRSNVFAALDKGQDIGVFSAAVADYLPAEYQPGKIASGGAITSIPLKQAPKVIQEVRRQYPNLYMVTFKYEDGISQEGLLEIAANRIEQGYQLVVANRAQEMGEKHHAYIVGEEGVIATPSSKKEIAGQLLDILGGDINLSKRRC